MLKHARLPHESHSVQLVDDRRVVTPLGSTGSPGDANLVTSVRRTVFARAPCYIQTVLKMSPHFEVLGSISQEEE